MKTRFAFVLSLILTGVLATGQFAPLSPAFGPRARAQAATLTAPNLTPIPITPVESDHPYKDWENKTWTINNNTGFNAGRIHFSRIEIEDGVESIQILDMSNQVIQEITTSAPDGMWSDIVPGLAVKVVFKSDGSGQYWDKYWGFKVDQLDGMNYTSVAYSPHPYANNWNDTKTLINSTPTQTATRVHFDRIELEPGVDYIIIRDVNNVPYQWITGVYADGFTSKAVPGPAIRVQIVSDGSGRAWGYNVDAVLGAAVADPADSAPLRTTIVESDHPYPPNLDRTWILTNPDTNVASTKVHFSYLSIDNDLWEVDWLYILDANDTVIQTLQGTFTDFWSDYVPGRVVKLRLVSSGDNQPYWGFRVDAIVNSVSHPGLAQSDHPYTPNLNRTWLLINPNVNATSTKVHFSYLSIDNDLWEVDWLYILDANDTVIQTLQGTFADFWSDYVPGRVVKLRLVSSGDNQPYWGFRADNVLSAPPTPDLVSIAPRSVLAGSSGFTLIVAGANFVSGSIVRWDNTDLATTFISDSQLTAVVPASLVATQKVASITVFSSGTPGTGQSNALLFTVLNPTPVLTSIDPSSIVARTPAFILTVIGANFVPESVVQWDGTNLTTAFVNENQITATVPASVVATAGNVNITVYSPGTSGTGQSNALQFVVLNPVPTLTSLNKTTAMAGDSGFDLELTGSSFVSSSVARWDSTDLATTFVNGTLLRAVVPASLLTTAGTFNVTVFNPTPGGGSSAAQVFTVNNPTPTLSSTSPTTAVTHRSFTLTVNGSNFNRSSVIRWGGVGLPTTFVSATRLTCEVPADLLSSAGSVAVTVFNPSPGGGESSSRAVVVWGKSYLPLVSKLKRSSAQQESNP